MRIRTLPAFLPSGCRLKFSAPAVMFMRWSKTIPVMRHLHISLPPIWLPALSRGRPLLRSMMKWVPSVEHLFIVVLFLASILSMPSTVS